MKLSRSADGSFSDAQSSRTSTVSPRDQLSISPIIEMPQMPQMSVQMHRQSQDFSYMQQNHSLLPHLRTDYLQTRHNQLGIQPMPTFTSAPQAPPRSIITSNPSNFGPPQPLEPPTNGTGSGGASPHMSNMGWGSPGHGGLPSPIPMDFSSYPDPSFNNVAGMYYAGNGMRRPQSTEPEDWSLRNNRFSNNHFNHHLQMASDWTVMPTGVDVKQERGTFAA